MKNNDTNTNKTGDKLAIKKDSIRFGLSIQLATELGFMVVVPLLAGTIGGIYLDNRFGTKPFLLLAGVLVGIVISIGSVFRIMGSLLDN